MPQQPVSHSGRAPSYNDVTKEENDVDSSEEIDEDHSVTINERNKRTPEHDITYNKRTNSVIMEEAPGTNYDLEYKTDKKRLEPNSIWKWVILVAAFFTCMCVEGVALSFGLLREAISSEFKGKQARTSLIGSMFIAVPFLTGPIVSALVDRWGCRYTTIVTGIVTTIAFLLAAASSTISVLILTIGIIGGLAVGFPTVSSHISVALWLKEERNWPVRLFSCSYGFGPLIFLPLIQYILKHYSLSDTMILIGGILLHTCICGALFMNPLSLEKKDKATAKLLSKKTICQASKSNSMSSSNFLSSESSTNGSKSSSSSKDAIDIKHDTESDTDAAVLPVRIKAKELTASSNQHIADKTKITKANSNENSAEGNSSISLRNRCKAMLSDHNYLKSITLYKNTLVCRGSMKSIPKYKLRSTLRPDVYNNSNWSLNSACEREKVSFLTIWMTPEISSDDVPTFTTIPFIMFNLCLFNSCAWSIFPYFFLKSFMDSKMVDGGNTVICVIAVATIIGTAFLSWAREQSWTNAIIVFRTFLFICGASLLAYPILIKYYWALISVSLLFGFALAGSQSLTTSILMDLVPMDKFTMAYCVVLLAQGLGYLIGAPLGGKLYDVTGEWMGTFWLGGAGMVVAGICACFVKVSSTTRQDFGSGYL